MGKDATRKFVYILALTSCLIAACSGGGSGSAAASQTGSGSTASPSNPDTVAPSIAITSPTSGPSFNTTGSTLSLSGTASDNVGVTQVTWSNSRGGSGTASGTTNWSISGISLQSGTNVITVTARDAAANVAKAPLSVTYATSATPPTVTSTNPAAGATAVATNSTIRVTFSQNMDPTTINATTFTLKGVAGTVQYSGTTATFTPSAALTASTTYTATVMGGTSGVKDLAGNTLASTQSWVFTTAAPTALHIQTVFLIVMENHNWSDISGNADAPYINNVLLPMASRAEQYFNPPGNHPSLPNYLWLEAGTNFGIQDDNDPSANHQSTTQHLVTYLQNKGISWKTYQESISGSDCPLVDNGEYAVRHNPFMYFDDVTNNRNPNSTNCISHVRPFSELATDLANNAVAQYSFITPNVCDDMHDACSPTNNSIKQGDTWLSQNLPTILASAPYLNGGAVFIVWDEAGAGDGPIGMIVLSPFAKGNGYQNSIHYTHGSTLRTVQEIFGVAPLLGDAASATDLSDLFAVFP